MDGKRCESVGGGSTCEGEEECERRDDKGSEMAL